MRLVYFSVEEVKKNGMIFSGFLNFDDFLRENLLEKFYNL